MAFLLLLVRVTALRGASQLWLWGKWGPQGSVLPLSRGQVRTGTRVRVLTCPAAPLCLAPVPAVDGMGHVGAEPFPPRWVPKLSVGHDWSCPQLRKLALPAAAPSRAPAVPLPSSPRPFPSGLRDPSTQASGSMVSAHSALL